MDSGMFNGVAEFIGGVIIVAIVSVLGLIGIGIYSLCSDNEYVVSKPIVPELRLVVKDNVIDTTYVYKFE